MDNRMGIAVTSAMTPYRRNAKPGDRILIYTDEAVEPSVLQAFMTAAHVLDIDAAMIMTSALEFHHAEPNPMARRAAEAADVIHLLTSKGAIHADAWEECMREGKRIIASEEITLAILCSSAATADYDQMYALGERIYDILNAGKTITITSAEGTNLVADISGRPPWVAAATARVNPGIEFNGCGFPDGECGVAPVESSIQGEIVWDTTMHHIGRLREPIRATVKDGVIVNVSGAQAEELKAYIGAHGDEGSWTVGETSIGLNPGAQITGNVRTDKKLLGSVHIAIGNNAAAGGDNPSRTHVDGVIRRPTWAVDTEIVVEDGRILVDV